MSLYVLQKLIRDVNRKPECREAWFKDRSRFVENYELSEDERTALLELDIRKLYAMGTHGLLLRPFTIMHSISEPDYLEAIRS